jgi:hypothetical protein
MLGGGHAPDGAERSRGDRRNLSGRPACQIFDGAADLGLHRRVGLLRCGFSIDGSLLYSDLPALTGFEHKT